MYHNKHYTFFKPNEHIIQKSLLNNAVIIRNKQQGSQLIFISVLMVAAFVGGPTSVVLKNQPTLETLTIIM